MALYRFILLIFLSFSFSNYLFAETEKKIIIEGNEFIDDEVIYSIIGKDINNDHKYHFVVKAETWFSMVPLGKWSLIGCIVVPAFDYKDFELAPSSWSPGKN